MGFVSGTAGQQLDRGLSEGDALLAGVAWALQSDLCFEDVARWGVATGTAAATREGVSVGTRAEVEVLYGKVRVTNTSIRM